jgi:hypothetical protein
MIVRASSIGVATLLFVASVASAHAQTTSARVTSEEIEPRTIGTTGTTMIGLAGYVDRFFSSEDTLPTNYTAQLDVGRFLTRSLVLRGGLAGTGRFGGDEAEDLPTGPGAAALHAFVGALFYINPQSIVSLYAGGDYWAQLSQRDGRDAGSVIGTFGAQGAVSSRASLFIEGGYGIGLTKGSEGETRSRYVARLGVRLKF